MRFAFVFALVLTASALRLDSLVEQQAPVRVIDMLETDEDLLELASKWPNWHNTWNKIKKGFEDTAHKAKNWVNNGVNKAKRWLGDRANELSNKLKGSHVQLESQSDLQWLKQNFAQIEELDLGEEE